MPERLVYVSRLVRLPVIGSDGAEVGRLVDVVLGPLVRATLIPHLRPASRLTALDHGVFEIRPLAHLTSLNGEDAGVFEVGQKDSGRFGMAQEGGDRRHVGTWPEDDAALHRIR